VATGGGITKRSWTSVDYASTAPAANKHDRQRLDLKLPDTGNGPFPLILYVHGGAFTMGNWDLSSNQRNGLLSAAPNKGYAIASAGYLLYKNNKASFPQMVEDILAAIRHLRANAAEYHLDPNKFVISGFSAGGYLTNIVCALSGTTHTYDITTLGNAGVSSDVQAAVSSAGLTDFSKLVEQSGSTMHNTMAGGPLGGNLTDNTQLMKDNLYKQNPLNWVSTNTPALYLRHGTKDGTVPYQQSQILFDKIKTISPNAETAGKLKFNKRDGKDHEDFDSSDAAAILDFLDKALGIQR
jgi:acetyl esterase/lipase